ncbi:MAG: GldG family protein [Endomicrobia bacterium]|nr:GldG family protein [Endomicrobiia bacterium]
MKKVKPLYINILLAILTVIIINLVFYFGFLRIDLTANRIYSLSKPSKKLVSKFDDKILIRAVFSKVLPEQFKFVRMYVEDILKEYRTYSRGKIKFEFIDPQQPKAKLSENDVISMGIYPIEFTVLEKDKFEVKKGYMGIAMLYRDRKEVIPVINNIETLEYDITTALKRLTIKERKAIGIVNNHRCNTLDSEELSSFKLQISKLYDFKPLQISSDTLKNVEGLLIVSPKENFDNKELFWLDQYILSGKPVAFLLDRYDVSLQNFWAMKINSNIFDFISHYGIEILDGLVADYQCQKVSLRTQQGFFVITNIVDYPFIPVITKFNNTHPLVKDLSRVDLPFVSALSVKSGLQGVSYTILMETSKYSFLKKDVYTVNPLSVDFTMSKDAQKGPFIVGLELKGKFKSYFADEDKFKNLQLNISDRLTEAKQDARILIISTSKFVDRETGLLGNIIDYIAQESDLLAIRSKDVTPPPLKAVSQTVKLLYRYFIMFVPAIIVVLAGLYRWYYRKNLVVPV